MAEENPFARFARPVAEEENPFAKFAVPTPVAQTQPQEVESNIFREIADLPLNLVGGAVMGTRILTDIAGATNPVSEGLRKVEGFIQRLLSAQAKADQQEVARIMAEAEDMGVGANLRAAARAFMVSPLNLSLQGLGSIIPSAAATAIGGVPGVIGYGVGSGVGLVKSAIFDAVNEALIEQGSSPEEARQAAEEAQAYAGDNLDMIATGGLFGYASTRFGAQPAIAQAIQKKLGDRLVQEGVEPAIQETLKRGVLSNLGRTAVTEAVPEAVQAGQEQLAQNLALQREDMDVPLMRGVIGSAALEGGIGALIGGGVGAVEAQRADTEIAERRAARAAQTAFKEEPAAVTEQQRQADADAADAAALFLEGTIEPTPIETAAPLTIDDTARPAAREWAPVIAAEVQNDSQGEIDRDVIIEKRQELAETYGEAAGAVYGRAMMDALNAQLRAQQEAPAARAAQQTQFEADEAEAARLAGESIAARMAAEQAAAAPAVEPVTEQASPAVEPVTEQASPAVEPVTAQAEPTVAEEDAINRMGLIEETELEQVVPTPAVEPVTVAQPATPTGATRGRIPLKRPPEVVEKIKQLSRDAEAESKAQRNDFVRVREAVERAEKLLAQPKFAEVFPTQEAFDAYEANPEAALVNEVAANIEAGMTPAAARKTAVKTLETYDSVKAAQKENRAKLVAALAQVIKTATSKRLVNTNRQKEALRILQDPSISAEDITAAVGLAQKAGLKVDESQFDRVAAAIPTRAERAKPVVKTATEPEPAADTDAEVAADVRALERQQTQAARAEKAIAKTPQLTTQDLLPPEVQAETTATGLFTAIGKLTSGTAFERSLATKLSRLTKDLGTKVVTFTDPDTLPAKIRATFVKRGKIVTAGLFDPVENTIYLHSEEGGDARTALHEGVHVVTLDTLFSYLKDPNSVPENARKAVELLIKIMANAGSRYAELKAAGRTTEALDRAAKSTSNFTDLKEFLSYGLTAPALQQMLVGMPQVSSGLVSRVRSAFSDLADAVMGMLNLPITSSTNALEQLIDLTGVVALQNAMAPYKASEVAQAKAQKKQISSLAEAVALRSKNIDDVLKNQKTMANFVSTTIRDPKAGVEILLNASKYVTGRAYRAMLRAADTNMLTAIANKLGIGMADRLAATMQELVTYRSKKVDESSKLANEWERLLVKNPDSVDLMDNLFRLSTVFDIHIYNVDSKSFVPLKNSIDDDSEVRSFRKTISYLGGLTNPTKEDKSALTKAKNKLTNRVQSITDMFQNYVYPLQAKAYGEAALNIYAKVQDKHRSDLNEAAELTLNAVRTDPNIPGTEADVATDKGRIMSGLNAQFAEMKKLRAYSPLSRPGKFAVRVRDSSGKQLYNLGLETDAQREVYMRNYRKANPTHQLERVNLGENKAENMRELLQGDGKKISDLFVQLDNISNMGPDAITDIKDAIYQLYLITLPSGAARKAAIHRTNDLGYDKDALRAFAINQSTMINQLARLKYGNQIRNEISAGRVSIEDTPDDDKRREKDTVVELLAERATVTLSPPTMGSVEEMADAASRLGTKMSFLFMLTSMRSAIIQPTQLIVFGFGGLHAKFGAGKTAAMAAKYMGNFLTARALSMTQLDETGNVVDQRGQPAMRNSKYVNSSPIKDVLQRGYDTADLRNTFASTRTADITGMADALESELRQAGGGGSISKGARLGMNLISAPIHHTEKVSREVFFMSALELAYEQQLARGKTGDAAIETSIETAIKLTNDLMFDYSALNKPLFAKAWYGRMGYQFMTYQVQALSHIIINFYKAFAASGLTKAEKREAAIKFWDTMGMGVLFGGVTGMFGYTAMVALIDGLREALRPDLDDEDADLYYDIDDAGNPLGLRSIDLYFRNHMLDKYFGPDSSLAKFMGFTPEQAQRVQRGVELGPISALTDWNAQASLELDGLLYKDFGNRDMSSEDTVVNFAFDRMFGPGASVVRNFAKGYETMVNEGEILRGLEMMAPAFLREPLEAMRFATDGNVTRAGDVLKPEEYYTGWKVVGQALGFGSTEVAESQVSTFAARKLIDEIKAEKMAVYDGFEKAFKERNAAVDQYGPESRQAIVAGNKFDDALQEVRRYNYKNFFDGISTEDLMSSLGERLRRDGITDEGLYLGDAVAPYLNRIIMPSRAVTNPPEETQ